MTEYQNSCYMLSIEDIYEIEALMAKNSLMQ